MNRDLVDALAVELAELKERLTQISQAVADDLAFVAGLEARLARLEEQMPRGKAMADQAAAEKSQKRRSPRR